MGPSRCSLCVICDIKCLGACVVMYDQYTPPVRVGGPTDMDWRGLAGSKSDKLSDRYLATKTPNIDSHQTR